MVTAHPAFAHKAGIIPRDLDNPEGKFPATFDSYQVVRPGDMVFCLFDIDETPRAVGLSTLAGMLTGAYTRFEIVVPDAREYVYYYYLAMDNGKRLKPLYSGLRKVITTSRFLSAKMPSPPTSERVLIVQYVEQGLKNLDRISDQSAHEIELIREFRARLVADVVTGKLDVREAAARLPAAAEEEVPFEDDFDDANDGSDPPDDDGELDAVDSEEPESS